MAERANFGVTPRMLELRAASSANYEPRSVFVTSYLAYQSAAVHPRGALWMCAYGSYDVVDKRLLWQGVLYPRNVRLRVELHPF
jgi:hypothetical protein